MLNKPVFDKRNRKRLECSYPAYKWIITSKIIFVNKKLTINDKKFTKNEKYLIFHIFSQKVLTTILVINTLCLTSKIVKKTYFVVKDMKCVIKGDLKWITKKSWKELRR